MPQESKLKLQFVMKKKKKSVTESDSMWDMGHKCHPPLSAPSLPPVVTHTLPPVNPPFKEVAQLLFTGSKQQMTDATPACCPNTDARFLLVARITTN